MCRTLVSRERGPGGSTPAKPMVRNLTIWKEELRWRFDSLKPFLVPGKARSKVEFSTGAYRTLLSMGYDIDSFVNGHLAVSELLGQTSGNGRFVQIRIEPPQ